MDKETQAASRASLRLRILTGLFGLVMLVTVGCMGGGSSQGRKAVGGDVSLDGIPLDQGAIRFEPQDSKVGTSSGAMVRQGHYEIPPAQGLVPGVYRVFLTASETAIEHRSADEIMNHPEPPRKERIPSRYNRESAITVQVKANGPNRFDFPIKTK